MTEYDDTIGGVAQLAESPTVARKGAGANPVAPAITKENLDLIEKFTSNQFVIAALAERGLKFNMDEINYLRSSISRSRL